jgi:hypothetical protein
VKNIWRTTGVVAALTLLILLAACSAGEAEMPEISTTDAAAGVVINDVEPVILAVNKETGSTSVDEVELATAVNLYPAGELSAEEAAALLFMREEEKLAHDVYVPRFGPK